MRNPGVTDLTDLDTTPGSGSCLAPSRSDWSGDPAEFRLGLDYRYTRSRFWSQQIAVVINLTRDLSAPTVMVRGPYAVAAREWLVQQGANPEGIESLDAPATATV